MNEYTEYIVEKEKHNKTFLIIWAVLLSMAFIYFVLGMYGAYKLYSRSDDIAYTKALEDVVARRGQIIKDKDITIQQLKNEMENFHEAHSMENFLLMLLNEDQKKKFETLEDYLEPYYYRSKDEKAEKEQKTY